MKKCPKPLGYGIRRTPVVLGLSAALCMPAAFSYANVDNGMDRESVLSVMQGKTIKGQILDETGESMIGVSVLVKGTTIGTVTDFDGNYTLEVPSGKNILEISYIGYKTKEITIGNNSLINIKMEPDTQALDEVVVIGYGTVKKRDLTGAVASMKNEDVTVAPTSNVMEALQGKIAGMDILLKHRKCHLLFVSIILIKVSICLHSQIVGMVCLSSQQGISGIVSLLEQLHGVSLTNLL